MMEKIKSRWDEVICWALVNLGVIGFIIFLHWYYKHLKPAAKLAEAAKK